MNSKDNSAFSSLGKALSYVVAFVLSVLINGFVTKFLWNGIVSSIFGIQLLTIGQAIALTTFIGYLFSFVNSNERHKSFYEIILAALFNNLIYLIIGWILMSFI